MRITSQIRGLLHLHRVIIDMTHPFWPRHRRRIMPIPRPTSMTHRPNQPILERRRILRDSLVLREIQDVVEAYHVVIPPRIALRNTVSKHGRRDVEFDTQVLWRGVDADGLCARAACWACYAVEEAWEDFGREVAGEGEGDGVALADWEDFQAVVPNAVDWVSAVSNRLGCTAFAAPGGVPFEDEQSVVMFDPGGICGDAASYSVRHF
jgi:hypothetical protein